MSSFSIFLSFALTIVLFLSLSLPAYSCSSQHTSRRIKTFLNLTLPFFSFHGHTQKGKVLFPHFTAPRDVWWHTATASVPSWCECEELGSESGLFILYVSMSVLQSFSPSIWTLHPLGSSLLEGHMLAGGIP